MLRLIKGFSPLFIAFLWLGCGEAKKSEAPDTKANHDFLERRKIRRAHSPPIAEAPIAAPATVTNQKETAEAFRKKLEAITGKPIQSDAQLLAKAESGDREAQAELGKKAFNAGDFKEGLKWAQKAAEQGDAGSQYGLAVSFTKGYGVEANLETAVKWFSLAANQGNVDAQASLAKRYALGEGVPQDKSEAYKWYDIAFKQGRFHGDVARDKFAATLTPAELAEGIRRSANFVLPKPP